MTELKYWIWLSNALGAGLKVNKILARFDDFRELYELDRGSREALKLFTKNQLDRLEKSSLNDAGVVMDICGRNGWNIITPDSDDYPDMLRSLGDMPLVLYVDGDITVLKDRLAIGIVGTRGPLRESRLIAREMASVMAKANIAVVSGGALGIDRCVHEGTMDADGKTVCVLGTGLGSNYLPENEDMRQRIAQTGALISEYPPFTSPTTYSFPKRNRIISGLSEATVVIEAGFKSGSLVTARCAMQQKKPVYAVPGNILDSAYIGTNNLLKKGAKVATCAEDVVNPYLKKYGDKINIEALREDNPILKPKEKSKPKKPENSLSGDIKTVYELFTDDPMQPSDLRKMSGLPVSTVVAALMELELKGFIKRVAGNYYTLI